jgi:hypothetical protein
VAVLTAADVRPRLNKTSTADDDEIQDLIDAAVAEFTELVGPLVPTTYTERHSGPVAFLRRRPVVAVVSVAAVGGSAVSLTDDALDAETGLLTLGGSGTYTITYTAGYGSLPGNIREAIIADVAGYFARTQRGGGFPGDRLAEPEPVTGAPVLLWPRIAAYARRHADRMA